MQAMDLIFQIVRNAKQVITEANRYKVVLSAYQIVRYVIVKMIAVNVEVNILYKKAMKDRNVLNSAVKDINQQQI